MKKKITIISISLFITSYLLSQTFSNSNTTTWNSSLTRTISVSGIGTLSSTSKVLKQVNLKLGQNGSGVGSGTSTYFIKLTAPSGVASCTICPSGGFNSTGVDFINIKYRDNVNLQYPSLTSGSRGAEPWDIGYYKVEQTSGGFSNFNGINADGTWTLTITESQVSNGLDFQNVDLIFGSPFNINDITSSSTNDACSAPQCFDNTTILIAKNQGYTGNVSTDPLVASPYVSGCDWNGVDNNTAWFFFRPTSSTATITVSGLQDVMQALIINPTFTCTSGSQSVPTGGCPLNAVNDTYRSPRYTSSSGSSANFQFKLSGLTPNSNYYMIIDGTGGNISKLYIELSGNSQTCSVILPIELSQFDYTCNKNSLRLNWTTMSETNNNMFTILGSNDGNEWFEIDRMNGVGTSTSVKEYNYSVPNNLQGTKYFKLMQTDYDGKNSYSKIINVKCEDFDTIDFYPNPTSNVLNINLKNGYKVEYELYNNLGQIINLGIINRESTQIDLSELASGVYYIKYNQTKTYKLIKN